MPEGHTPLARLGTGGDQEQLAGQRLGAGWQ